MQEHRTVAAHPSQAPSPGSPSVVHPVSNTGVDVLNPCSSGLEAGLDWLGGKYEVRPDDGVSRRPGAPQVAYLDLCSLLGVPVDRWEFTTPRKGYTKAVAFLGASLSWALLDGERDMARFDMPASALAAWQVAGFISDLPAFLARLQDNGVAFDRGDVCLDEVNGNLDIGVLCQLCADGNVSSKAQRYHRYAAPREIGAIDWDSDTLYVGSFKSDKLMRIYDKRDQSRPAEVSRAAWRASQPRHIRVELQCRDESADALVSLIVRYGLQMAAKGAIAGFVEFKDGVRNHRSRSLAPKHPMWAAFLGAVVKLRVSVMPREMTVHGVVRWIVSQCGSSLRMIGEYEASKGRSRYDWVRQVMQGAELRPRHQNMLALAGLSP